MMDKKYILYRLGFYQNYRNRRTGVCFVRTKKQYMIILIILIIASDVIIYKCFPERDCGGMCRLCIYCLVYIITILAFRGKVAG